MRPAENGDARAWVGDPDDGTGKICFDFDGVLHAYSRGWADGTIYDVPVPGASAALRQLRAAGFRVVVVTSRTDLAGVRAWLDRYCLGHLIDEVSNEKIACVAYVDDRGVRFDGDWSETVCFLLSLRGSAKDSA